MLVRLSVSPVSPPWGQTPFPKTVFVSRLIRLMPCVTVTVATGIGLPADAPGAGWQAGQTCWVKEEKS